MPTKQDEPFEEQKGTGSMKHNLLFIRNFSTGQKMCAISLGKTGVEMWRQEDYK